MATKGNTTARGYGAKHQRLREWWAPKVKAGQVRCWRCGQPIQPWQPWDLGHDDTNRSVTRGPEHRHRTPWCVGNRGAGAIKVNQVRAQTKACPVCGKPKPANRSYCSQRCGYLAHKDDPPRVKTPRTPKPKPAPKYCAVCGQPVAKGRSRHCSEECMIEYNRRAARNRYQPVAKATTAERWS